MNRNFLLVIILASIVYTANIWGNSIYVLDEAKNSGCAMEMYERGNWIVPTFNGELRTDKPPLHYFFMMASYKLFGVNPFSARVFSSLMGILTVISVYLFTRKILNEGSAFLAALLLISSIQLAIQFHLAVPDPYLIFFLTTACLSIFLGFQTGKAWFLYLFYACVSLATLTKGPVALVFSGLIVLIYLITQKRFSFKELVDLKIIPGFLIFCIIVLPWYAAVGIQTKGEWLNQFFFKHNVSRFTSSMEGHGGFPLASFVIVIVGLLPFSFFAPQMIKALWKKGKEQPFLLFCFISILVVAVFFAFSRTILPTYPEPALPFFAILLGYFIHSKINDDNVKSLRGSAIAYAIISLALPAAVLIALQQDPSLKDLVFLSNYFTILTLGAFTGLYFIWNNLLLRGIYSYVISITIFLLVFFYIIFPQVDRKNPVVRSLPVIRHTTKTLYYYGDFNPAYVMGLHKIIPELKDLKQNVDHSIIISQKRYFPALDSVGYKILYEGQDLFERPVTIVVGK